MNIFFKCNKIFKILNKTWRIMNISFRFLNKTGKNHEQILFSLTKLIYTQASGHVNFWDFKLVCVQVTKFKKFKLKDPKLRLWIVAQINYYTVWDPRICTYFLNFFYLYQIMYLMSFWLFFRTFVIFYGNGIFPFLKINFLYTIFIVGNLLCMLGW